MYNALNKSSGAVTLCIKDDLKIELAVKYLIDKGNNTH